MEGWRPRRSATPASAGGVTLPARRPDHRPHHAPLPARCSHPLRDAWLLATLERLLPDGAAARLLAEAEESYWESALRLGLATDHDILEALARRFRMPIADLSALDLHAREAVPESLARRHRVVPL